MNTVIKFYCWVCKKTFEAKEKPKKCPFCSAPKKELSQIEG